MGSLNKARWLNAVLPDMYATILKIRNTRNQSTFVKHEASLPYVASASGIVSGGFGLRPYTVYLVVTAISTNRTFQDEGKTYRSE
jgi:hypothetical protein